MVQRQVFYLGEINDSQREAWCRVIETFDEETEQTTQLALFPADRPIPEYAEGHGVQIRLGAMQLHRPRQWGACWLACQLYEQLELDRFWAARLPNSREGTCWRHILETLVCYRLIDPGSEWRLHRLWFEQSAMGSDPPVAYLVGTPKGRLGKLEKPLVGLPRHGVRPGVEVKLMAQDGELYVLAQSRMSSPRAGRASTRSAPCESGG